MPGALELYKLLPKTNCGKCNSPTCLAFAMRLASNNAHISDCPDVSDEVRQMLDDASRPAVNSVTLSIGENKLVIGGETVFFRHDKKFVNPTVLSIALSDQDLLVEIDLKLQERSIERLSEKLSTNMVALMNDSNQEEPFIRLVNYVQARSTVPVLLFSKTLQVLKEALKLIGKTNPLIGPLTEENIEDMIELTKQYNCPVIVSSTGGLAELSSLVKKVSNAGISDLVLDCSGANALETLKNLVSIRWRAVNEKDRSLSYPTISFPFLLSKKNLLLEIINAGLMVVKYSSIVVLDSNNLNHLVPLFVLRMNIFTDPQKPIQVSPRLYSLGAVDENSPVFLTTNFSLTYFTVSNDIESSGFPSYLLIVDTEGTSVLTAYAADKINEEKIADALKNANLESLVTHRKLIIPGYLSPLSFKIEEQTGWEVLVGPADSSDIPLFIKRIWSDN